VTEVVTDGTGGRDPKDHLLRTAGLTRHFRIGGLMSKRLLHAVDGVDMTIDEGEILALVGESGSGKSTIARLIVGLYPPTAGEIWFRGTPLSAVRSRQAKLEYRAQVPMVFQDPYSSLSPTYRISHPVMRSLTLHRPDLSRGQRAAEAQRVMDAVGLTPAAAYLQKFPHELSGGQRQRVGFAQALAARPRLIVADEPVSMLDVSIRVGLLNLMDRLRTEQGLSILYITHDIASARYAADRIMVMYAGQQVELGPTEEVLSRPRHPYTELLLAAVPDPRAPVDLSAVVGGEPPKVVDPGEGCRFRDRCPYVMDVCHQVTPHLTTTDPGHLAACHLIQKPAGPVAPDIPLDASTRRPAPDRCPGASGGAGISGLDRGQVRS
jgi:peptide/nickel transport system ATP-binding protein